MVYQQRIIKSAVRSRKGFYLSLLPIYVSVYVPSWQYLKLKKLNLSSVPIKKKRMSCITNVPVGHISVFREQIFLSLDKTTKSKRNTLN